MRGSTWTSSIRVSIQPLKLASEVLREYPFILRVDALLAPIGLVIAFGVAEQPTAILLVLPLVGLFRLFGRERAARVDQTLELSSAYRGTALLLGDVIGEDDEYTGALLHDVGKIAIPKSIIKANAGTQFDPRVVDALLAVVLRDG
jgi:hypothetical protein